MTQPFSLIPERSGWPSLRLPNFVDGIAVEVLAVDGNSALFNNGRHSVHKPVKGLLVPEVKLEGVALDTVGNLFPPRRSR